MSRIRIEDLPVENELGTDDLKSIFGAGVTPDSIDSARRLFAPVDSPLIDGLPDPVDDDPHRGRNPFLDDGPSDPVL